jgi:hypothetical protein
MEESAAFSDLVSNFATIFSAMTVPRLSHEECCQVFWLFSALRDRRAAPFSADHLVGNSPLGEITKASHEEAQRSVIRAIANYSSYMETLHTQQMTDLRQEISTLKSQLATAVRRSTTNPATDVEFLYSNNTVPTPPGS